MIETIFLDAGGVLVNPNWERVSATLARHGAPVTAAALEMAEPHAKKQLDTGGAIQATNDTKRGWMYFNLVLQKAGLVLSEGTDAALRELHEYHAKFNLWESVPREVPAALDRLRAAGHRLVVVSNSNGTLRAQFARLDLARRFDVLIDSADEGVEKPDPRIFELALERSGSRAETTLHAGDFYHVDVVGARAAGLQAWLIDAADLYADHDVVRVRSLAALVDRLLAPAGLMTAGLALPGRSRLLAEEPSSPGWRTFETVTRVEVLRPSGVTRVWVPTALSVETPYQRTLSNVFRAAGAAARQVSDPSADAVGIVAAEFPAGVRPVVTVTSRVMTRDHEVDLTAPRGTLRRDRAALGHFMRPTKLLAIDGVVRDKARQITGRARGDEAKARAIYEWIVDNTTRDPKVRGCGRGDIKSMLETGNLAGKCADLNTLYVGLARASGLPARDVYGIRVAKSELGYQSLGPSTPTITKAQHCRAEVYLTAYGWVPVDPADVRKVVLEEPPGNRPLDDLVVRSARIRLFGFWEMNWMAYNFGHDVILPGSAWGPIEFLMYPQAETARGRVDSLDPDSFRYEITSRETGPVTTKG
jgi:HAD superfamily hydrolase (TIGR01549 family)